MRARGGQRVAVKVHGALGWVIFGSKARMPLGSRGLVQLANAGSLGSAFFGMLSALAESIQLADG